MFREIFSDDKGQLSSGRIMAMIALLGGLALLFLQTVGYSECGKEYLLAPISLLVGGALGGKTLQKKFEK